MEVYTGVTCASVDVVKEMPTLRDPVVFCVAFLFDKRLVHTHRYPRFSRHTEEFIRSPLNLKTR